MNWKAFLQQILLGAAAGFVQSESTPNTSLAMSGAFAGLGALAGAITALNTHPAVVASQTASAIKLVANTPSAANVTVNTGMGSTSQASSSNQGNISVMPATVVVEPEAAI